MSASGPQLDNRRVLAGLVDLAVIGVGAAVILAAAGVLGGGSAKLGAPLVGVLLCWALYYYFACESGSGQTLGKKLLKIRVVRTDGAPAGMREIAIRTVVRVIDMQFVYLVGLIAMLATGERRGRLGDLAADTMIVSVAESAVPQAPAASPAEAAVRAPSAAEPDELVFAEAPVAPAVPELQPFEPVAEPEPAEEEPEPAEEQPEPAEEEPAPAAEEQPAPVDEPTPDVASPSLKELAADVAAAKEPADGEPLPEEEPDPVAEEEPEPAEPQSAAEEPDEPEVTVKPVDTVSAIDLVMEEGLADEDLTEEDLAELMGDESPADTRRH